MVLDCLPAFTLLELLQKKASPYLKALLQNEGKLHPWVRLVIHDLEELQGCSPKLHMLLPPSLDVDAWVAFAIAYPKSWRKFIQAWLTSASPAQTDVLMGTCAFLLKSVARKCLGAHNARAHAQTRLSRMFCTRDGICPVCDAQFPSRLRCIHHIHHSTSAGLAALAEGQNAPLEPEEIIILDALDARFRLCSRSLEPPFLLISDGLD